jgi:hypothetical protein
LNAEISRLNKAYEKLTGELPQRPIYELERDPLFAEDIARWKRMKDRIKELEANAKRLEGVDNKFNECKRRERIQASLRKSGQRLTPENRSKLMELGSVVGTLEGPQQFIAKYLPDEEIGRKATEELKERKERLPALWQELKRTLPAAHIDFIAEAIK